VVNVLSIGECIQLACVLEATACKPGNVSPRRDFDDLTYLDFILSAAAIGPVLERAAASGVGQAIHDAVVATSRFVAGNCNLGTVLLLAPLAAASVGQDPESGIGKVLEDLTVEDSRRAFVAIRLAAPGGLGQVPEQDVRGEPTLPLQAVMALAAGRDLIARQYANGFQDVFELGVPALAGAPLEDAIIGCHLRLLATLGDTHIERRCGARIAGEARRRAADVLNLGWPGPAAAALAELDEWLRADGHRRNPGSTADLVAASLFVALRRRIINFPLRFRQLPKPTGRP
jgi:triphosphoribosyl-dephospho-CoA synthase